jgi:DNA-binding PadR family transcriptional regulator
MPTIMSKEIMILDTLATYPEEGFFAPDISHLVPGVNNFNVYTLLESLVASGDVSEDTVSAPPRTKHRITPKGIKTLAKFKISVHQQAIEKLKLIMAKVVNG